MQKMYRAGGDGRGSSRARRRSREWLVSPEAGRTVDGEWVSFGGDDEKVPCWWGCGTLLTVDTVERDRIEPGGSYARTNIVPACRPCNLARSDDADLTREQIAARVMETFWKHGRLTPDLAR